MDFIGSIFSLFYFTSLYFSLLRNTAVLPRYYKDSGGLGAQSFLFPVA